MIIKCSKSDSVLEFSEKEGLSRSAGRESFRVTIRSKHLYSFTDVYIFDPYDFNLVRFFQDLAENWKGFKGEKKWNSLEDEFRLTCTSDNLGHFALEIVIRDFEDLRCAIKTIYLESGQLEEIALEVRKFFNFSEI